MTALAFALAGCAGDTTTYVKKGVSGLTIEYSAKSVVPGEPIELTAKITPADAYYESIKWKSSDKSVFSIADGGIKAVAVGMPDDADDEDGVSDSRNAVITVEIGNNSASLDLFVYRNENDIPPDDKKGGETDPDDSVIDDGTSSGDGTVIPPESSGNGGGNGKPGQGMTGSTGEGNIGSAASVTITRVVGWLESAYLEWNPVPDAAYTVRYKKSGTSAWSTLDTPLIRDYGGFIRADVLGLEHGKYEFEVSANDGAPATASASVASHDRCGYAFTSDTVPGAYNENGTLKDGAIVIYVDNDNFDSVKLTVVKDKKGQTIEFKGVQSIVNNNGYCKYAEFNDNRPVCIRVIGKIDTDGFPKSSWQSSKEGLQIKGDGKKNTMITLEGVGDDATLHGFGVLCRSTRYVEIRNLGFMCFADDGISLDTDNLYTWIHNCDVFYGSTGGDSDQAKGDGSLDVKGNSKWQTYSYNHFWDSGKMSLCGMKDESGPNYITYHHNWFDHSDSRHPRIRTMTVHIYNNYYDGNSKYGVGATTGADAFVEANYFRNVKFPMMSSLQGNDVYAGSGKYDPGNYGTFSKESGGSIKSWNNKIVDTNKNTSYWPHKDSKTEPLITKGAVGSLPNGVDTATHFDAWEASSRDEKVPATVKAFNGGDTYSNFDTASGFYGYTPDDPETAKENVTTYAGRIELGDFEFEGFGSKSTDATNATQDTNDKVVAALKTAVVNYKSSLVKIYGITDKAVYNFD